MRVQFHIKAYIHIPVVEVLLPVIDLYFHLYNLNFRVKALLNNSTSLATSPVTMETAVATGDRWPMTTGMSSSCQQHTVPMWGDAAGEEERLWSQVGRYDTTVSRLGMGILQDLMIEVYTSTISV